MKKKISLINLSKDELSKKQKKNVYGGYVAPVVGQCLCNTDHQGECGRFDRKG